MAGIHLEEELLSIPDPKPGFMRDGLLQAFKSQPFLSPYRVGRRPGQQGPHRPLRGQRLEKYGTGMNYQDACQK